MKKLLFLIGTLTAVLAGALSAQTTNINIAAKTLESYVGQYELAPGFVLTIRKEGDHLTGQATGQPRLRLVPQSETDFKVSTVDASLTFVKKANGKATELVLHQNGDKTARKTSDVAPALKTPDLSKIPRRDPKAASCLVDLTGKYNALLTEQWHPDANGLPAGANDLGSLPRGVQKLAGTEFDVRGVIQLTGTQAEFAGGAFPESQTDIKIGQKCKQLTMLQATGWPTEDGTTIGKYVLHYAGGAQATLSVVYGVDVRDWWHSSSEPKEAKSAAVAWSGSNPATEAAGASLQLFKRTYDNPKPDLMIESMDFVSAQSESAPFLIAVRVEN